MHEKTDVLIIGGGVIGVCIAHYLAEAGKTVRIIERDEIGSACSSQNAGLIVPSHVIRLARPGMLSQGLKWLLDTKSPFYIKPRLDPSLISWLWKFMHACSRERMQASIPVLHNLLQESYNQYENLAQKLDFGWTHKGLLMMCKTEQALKHEIADAEIAQKAGLEIKILKKEEIQKLEPNIEIDVIGGAYYTQDTHIDPRLFVRRIRENFNSGSVKINTNATASGFSLNGNEIQGVQTTAGDFNADEFIIAGGAWSPAVAKHLGIKIPIQAGKGCSVTTTAINHAPQIPFILSEAKIAVTPIGGGLRFAGTMELSPPDFDFSRKRVHAMLEKIPSYLPEIDAEALKELDVWVGPRPCTPDGIPIISRTEKFKNLTVATGHAMLGVSLAPVTGLIVNNLLNGHTLDFDFKQLSLKRF